MGRLRRFLRILTFEGPNWRYDVALDGRFVLVETLEQPAPAIRVVQNWFAEFRDREQN